MVPKTEFTYTVADLERFEFPGTALAVLGNPVRHSISPAMHNAALAKLCGVNDRFKDWAYYRFEVPATELPKALKRFHEKNFLGLNLTIPHKVEVLPHLYGASDDAHRMGASNTLLWGELGYEGFNTDGYGLERALQEDLGVQLNGTPVILLGAGGAARAAAVQCLARGCSELWIGNRSIDRLDALRAVLGSIRGAAAVKPFALAEPPKALPPKGVLINATSLGLKATDPLPFAPSLLPRDWVVFDMIYNPAVTPLLRAANAAGLRAANGLAMLVHQGARSLSIWTRENASSDAMMAAACHALNLPPRYVRNL